MLECSKLINRLQQSFIISIVRSFKYSVAQLQRWRYIYIAKWEVYEDHKTNLHKEIFMFIVLSYRTRRLFRYCVSQLLAIVC